MDSSVHRTRNSIQRQTPQPVDSDGPLVDDEAIIEENTPLALVPSKASSVTVVEKDIYLNLQPITHTHGWKPETMQAPVLVGLALSSLLLAALVELLAQQSAIDGALYAVNTPEKLPGIVNFAYLYLPTIVAVLYSLAWNWVDLDVKRMQPWLQLSRDDGATGRDSLFLDYPVDFVASVPFKAAKRRHWETFCSGTTVVLVFWILTPMQGAVFGTAPVLSRRAVNMTYPLDLVDASQQAAMLDQSVLNAGYAITWLDQALPPYTTAEYALRPFSPSKSRFSSATAVNWTGPTTKYWTTLDCWPAKLTRRAPEQLPGVVDADDGRGCNVSSLLLHPGTASPGQPYKMTYIGYQDSGWADYALGSPTCGPAARNKFLATTASWDDAAATVNFTSSFCEAAYWRQDVTATVASDTLRPVDSDTRPRGPPEPLRDAEFNTSAFQFLLGVGVSSVSNDDRPRDYPFTTLLEHYPRLQTTGLRMPLSPLVGFAVGGQKATVDRFAADAAVMTNAFASAHKMLFSVAYSRLLAQTTATATATTAEGEVRIPQYGVVVSRAFSAVVEGVLLAVVLMALLLLRVCRAAPSMLSEDPASMDALLRLVGDDDSELAALFSGTGHMSDEELQLRLCGYRLRLRCGCAEGRGRAALTVVGSPDYDEQVSRRQLLDKGFGQSGYLAPVKPVVLRTWAGVVFIVVLCSVIGLLVYLNKTDAVFGGLSQPSSNIEVNLLLTNYLPTAFSTLIEPLWVLLNRFHCMLQPFHDLVPTSRRSRRPRNTHAAMRTRYTARPPQLVFLSALRSGHFLLASVCVAALLGSVLAVGLGGLLRARPTTVSQPLTFPPHRQPLVSREGLDALLVRMNPSDAPPRYDDPYHVVMANMSYGTVLPPWTTSEFSFLPLTIPASGGDGIYTSETTGFGVNPDCAPLGVFESRDRPARVRLNLPAAAAANGSCPQMYTPASLFLNETYNPLPEGAVAAEDIGTPTNTFDRSACDGMLLVGWSRADSLHSGDNRTGVLLRTSLLACRPTLRTARFRVAFDATGRIRAATPLTAVLQSSSWPYYDPADGAPSAGQSLLAVFHYRLRNRAPQWHAASVSRDWLNYLVKVHMSSRNDTSAGASVTDPAASLPDPSEMVASVSAVYKMVFAALLSLSPDLFTEADADGSTNSGVQLVRETRVFVSAPAFVVCVVVLGAYVFVAAAHCHGVAVRQKLFLPRIPSTVGSVLAYVVPSSIATGRDERVALRFGRYVGSDGRAQMGIDIADKIVPLDMKRLGYGDTRPSRFRFLRFGRSRTEETWL